MGASQPMRRRVAAARKNGSPSGVPLVFKSTPAARSAKVVPRQPIIRQDKRSTFITGHELLASVNGSASFAATKYQVNPGLPSFTWLSERAKGWEKYRFSKFQVCYVPAEAVTTTAGSAYLAADYDPVDSAPSSLAAMSTYETQDNDRIYNAFKLDLSSKRMFDGVQHKKIRCGPVAGDLQLYDGASFTFATVSCANTDPIGQLWVSYEVELISPQTDPTAPVPPKLLGLNLSSNQTITSGVAAPIAFDEEIVGGFDLISNTSGVLVPPCGTYKVSAEITCKDTAAEDLTSVLFLYQNGAALSVPVTATASGTMDANGFRQMSIAGYVYCDGSDTLQIRCSLTGAAGTLSLISDNCRVFLEAV